MLQTILLEKFSKIHNVWSFSVINEVLCPPPLPMISVYNNFCVPKGCAVKVINSANRGGGKLIRGFACK